MGRLRPVPWEEAINVEHGPERQDGEQDDDGIPSRPEPAGPSTGGVRIIGAETAADITSEVPVVPPAHISPEASSLSSVRIVDEPAHDPVDTAPEAPPASPTELPHWTEPPTGQVPAVLARDEGEASAILPPTWREEDADWTAHEEGFDSSMFGDDRTALGALDETRATDQERRPWEFDLDSVRPGQPGPSAKSTPAHVTDPITEPVDIVGAPDATADRTVSLTSRPVVTGDVTSVIMDADVAAVGAAEAAAPMASAAASATGSADVIDVVTADLTRPSGSPRLGRARRSGLLPARLKAKRPDDDVLASTDPLAGGASVADVPGAGRRKPGLAGLAAADRAAEQEHVLEPTTAPNRTADPVEEPRARRRLRGPSGSTDRPLRASSNHPPDVTGGGPPGPVTPRSGASSDEHVGGSAGLRIGTGVAVAIIALLAFKIGTITALILCLVVVTFSAGEAFAVLKKSGWRPATLLGLVGTISLMVGAYNKGIAALPLVLVLVTAFTLLWYLFGVERGSAVAGTASTMLVIGWVALLGSYAGLLLAPSTFPNRHGIAFLLGAIVATVANDVGALVVGRWIGSRQLAPAISPNKTWEGLVGGALSSILVSTIVIGSFVHPWTPANAALLGIVVAVVAPLGDLCESLLKRDLRLKDMGTLLPGHGGVLDRVDALLFVLPATYYLVRALNIA